MKHFSWLVMVVASVMGSAAHGESALRSGVVGDLLVLRYTLKANRPLTTGWRSVYGAPARVNRIKILQTGNYCDIVVDRVEYTTSLGGYAKRAYLGTNGYEIPEGSLASIKIDFEQRTWDNANCDLSVTNVSDDGGGNGYSWFNLRTIQPLGSATAEFTRNCGRRLREAISGVQCYASYWKNEMNCKDPQGRAALMRQISCVGNVGSATLEPSSAIDWNQPL